ncbi:hypothetical protein GH714_034666 [Hevea brasiliensis]|uniref:Uncharacterized protein n=1 Tax=Hevea brasiliensis TaxID=3981 RepID=A0A6A6KVF2_HEVBR|nr:hypothetical protein GH714_034666 [Hevea brasiliensis]
MNMEILFINNSKQETDSNPSMLMVATVCRAYIVGIIMLRWLGLSAMCGRWFWTAIGRSVGGGIASWIAGICNLEIIFRSAMLHETLRKEKRGCVKAACFAVASDGRRDCQ